MAVDVGRNQLGDDVIAGMVGLVCGELHAIEHQFPGRRQRLGPGEFGVLVAHHLVGPVKQLRSILEGHPEQTGDQLQRQLAGHLRHEVPGSGRGCVRHDAAGPLCQVLAKTIYRARREHPATRSCASGCAAERPC